MAGKGSHWCRWVSRRRVLRGAALGGVGLAAASLLSCRTEEKPAVVPAAQPRRGGTVVRQGGFPFEFVTSRKLDPHVEAGRTGESIRAVYQGLLGYHLLTYEMEPDLAQSWEQPSETEYIFKLPPVVKWQDKPPANGRELVAEDVVFSLNRARTDNPLFPHRSLLISMDRVEAVDRHTVRVTARRPDVTLLAALGSDGVLVLNPEVVETAKEFRSPDEVVGTGAFILKSVTERVGAEFVRNPTYYKPGLPYLDGLRLPYFADQETAFAAFQAGKLDIMAQIPGTRVKEYIASQGPSFTPQWYDDDGNFPVVPNTAKEPFNDPRVTRALRLLIDHDEFITAWAEVVFGRGIHGSVFPAALKAWDASQEEYKRSIFWQQPKEGAIREALELLRAAGFTRDNPLRFELTITDSQTVKPGGELLHTQFVRNGQGVVQPSGLRVFDAAIVTARAVQGNFECEFIGTAASIAEPGVWFNQIYRTGASRNFAKYSDARLDAMIDKQNVTFNVQERKAQVLEIVRSMMERSPVVAVTLDSSLNALSPKVQGFLPDRFLRGRQYQWVWLAA